MDGKSKYASTLEIARLISNHCDTEDDVVQMFEIIRKLVQIRATIQTAS